MNGPMTSRVTSWRAVRDHWMGAVACLCIGALGTSSCSDVPISEPAVGGLTSANFVELALPQPGQGGGHTTLVVQSEADVNLRPIRLWFVEEAGNVKALYVMGHADGECCPEISGILHNLASRPGIKNGWLSFGYGHFEAENTAGSSTLNDIRAKLEKKASAQVCQGQVAMTRALPSDRIRDDSTKLLDVAGRAFQKSKELDRPLLLSHRLDGGHPRVVPASVSGGSGTVSLDFRIPLKELAPPKEIISSFTLDGVPQAIAAIRAQIAAIDAASVDLDDLPAPFDVEITTNYRAAKGISDITAATARINTVLSRLSASNTGKQQLATLLEQSKSRNGRALAALMALPEQPQAKIINITYQDIELTMSSAKAAERAKLTASLQKWQASASKTSTSKLHPVLVDAFLRGWPASFVDAKAETAYENWLAARQKPVWAYISAQLAKRGVDTGEKDGPGVFQRSNVVFEVRAEKEDMVVTPFFVVTGATLQVADPAAGLVHYELLTTDQNLAVR